MIEEPDNELNLKFSFIESIHLFKIQCILMKILNIKSSFTLFKIIKKHSTLFSLSKIEAVFIILWAYI